MKLRVSYYSGQVATKAHYPHLMKDEVMDRLVDIVSAFEEKNKITIDFIKSDAIFELKITDIDLDRDIGALAEDLFWVIQDQLKV